MIDFMQIDLKWLIKFLQIIESFQRLAAPNLHLAANQSRIISQLSDYITENRHQVYENIRPAFDRVNRNFIQYVRGVDSWLDPCGEAFELPADYEKGWQNNDGTRLITANPHINPGQTLCSKTRSGIK